MKLSTQTVALLWILVAAIFFIPFLGNVHLFDWDEINFAEIAREMNVSGNYGEPQINFMPFTEKPPLFFWLQAISMKLFGVNEFAARFPNALLGVMVMPLIYNVGKKLRDHQFGILWSLVYFGTILPHLYFKSGIIDPWFNFFIFSSVYCLIQSAFNTQQKRSSTSWIIAGGIFLGLAVLTKGPAAILIVGLTFLTCWVMKKFRKVISFPNLIHYGVATLLITGIWFGINYLQRGDKFLIDFTVRQWELLTSADAGHKGFFLFHFVMILFGCFPASVFLIRAFWGRTDEDEKLNLFKKWMAVLFWVVLILFTLVKTKIVHYSSLCYYPLSFLAAWSLYNIVTGKWKMERWMRILLVVTSFPFIVAPIGAAWVGQHIDKVSPYVKVEDIDADITANVAWSGWEFLPGLLLLIVVVLSLIWFKQQKNRRAIYLLFIGTAVYMQISLFFFIGRVEGYSQRAPIEFWQSHADEDCYMTTYHYASYTQYYYGKARPYPNKNYTDKDWLLTGDVDKKVYIICQFRHKADLERELPDAKYLYSKNGFYFYERPPVFK